MSEPKYHTTIFFSENLLTVEIKRTQILMNNPVFLVLYILEANKIVMHDFWCDYVKRKYRERAKLC